MEVKARPSFTAKDIWLFLGGRAVDPVKRFREAVFELQCKRYRAPSFERARQG
jgi:hypothetical protein